MTQPHDEQQRQLEHMSHGVGMFGGLDSRQMVRPLWLVFSGGVLSILALGLTLCWHRHTNWILHLTDQPIGAALITIGVWRLARIDMGRDYIWLMRFILVVSVLQTAASIVEFFPLPEDPLFALAHIVIGFASIVAVIGFCVCMRWFCQDTRLWRSARGWFRTTVVFCCACVPAGLFEFFLLLVALKIIEYQPPTASVPNWSWWYLTLVPFIAGPPWAFLSAILHMHREMLRREASEPEIVLPAAPLAANLGE